MDQVAYYTAGTRSEGDSVMLAEATDERVTATRPGAVATLSALSPPAMALAYPYILALSSWLIGQAGPSDPAGPALAIIVLLLAMSAPLHALSIAIWLGRIERPSAFQLRARRLAFVSMAAPPLFVFCGVALGLVGSPVRDVTAWTICWAGAVLFGARAAHKPAEAQRPGAPRLRIFHGATAALLLVFVAFHLGNHLAALLGPDVHARIMQAGRAVYRSGIVEPVLVALLLVQVMTGGRLAWSWTASGGGFHRTVQIGSGVYLAAFIVTHLDSALVSARWVRDIPTDWAWASGAPEGLLNDAWNIRLLPHYAFGVIFVLMHLTSALRVLLMAHGVSERVANAVWIAGAIVATALAGAIVAALLGVRV